MLNDKLLKVMMIVVMDDGEMRDTKRQKYAPSYPQCGTSLTLHV